MATTYLGFGVPEYFAIGLLDYLVELSGYWSNLMLDDGVKVAFCLKFCVISSAFKEDK